MFFHRRFIAALFISVLLAVTLMAQTSDEARAVARLQRVAQLISDRDLANAESELQSLLQVAPTEARALNLLGVVRAEQGRAREAEELFKRAQATSPQLLGARANLGRLYLSEERAAEAVAEFEAVLAADPKRSDAASSLVIALRRLAVVALTAGDNEKALSHLLRVKMLTPADADVQFEFGMTALKLGLNQEARAALASALKARPDEPKFVYALARAQLAISALAEAEALFKRYVEMRPQDATGYYGLGYTLGLMRRTDQAALRYKRSLELQPAQTEAPYQLGLIADAEGNLDEAVARFEQVLARHPDHAGARLGLGVAQFKRKQYDLARQNLERAVTLEPSLVKAHYQLGLTLARLGERDASTRELELAARLEREQKQQRRAAPRLIESEAEARP